MIFLFYFALVSLLWATAIPLPDGKFYNCSGITSLTACIATQWCIWVNLDGGSCIYDECLKWVSDETDSCGTDHPACKLNYLTDDLDCTTGAEINRIDRFCRSSNELLSKRPIDECFYQDLKSRFDPAGNTTKCQQLAGGISCANVSQPDNFYCYRTGNVACSDYFNDHDSNGIPIDRYGFCDCLGKSNCYLYPYCTLTTSNTCVADPCGFAEPNRDTRQCGGAGLGHCSYKAVLKVKNDGSGTETLDICYTGSNSTTHQVNNWNQCFFGLQSKVKYVNPAVKIPKCASLDERNKCEDVPLSDGSGNCKVYPIVANYFVEIEANYCSDGKEGHVPPAPGAGSSIIRVPTLIAFFLLVAWIL